MVECLGFTFSISLLNFLLRAVVRARGPRGCVYGRGPPRELSTMVSTMVPANGGYGLVWDGHLSRFALYTV